MVFGPHKEICWKCRREFMSGDSVEGVCPECKSRPTTIKNPCVEIDLTQLVSPYMKERLKQEIQIILKKALVGVVTVQRYKKDDVSYIRWNVIQQRINETIDLYWPKESGNEG